MSYLYPEGKGQKSTPNTGDINRFNFIDRTKINSQKNTVLVLVIALVWRFHENLGIVNPQ